MAITNQERVGKALELLKDGLAPFVERELKAQDAQGWLGLVRQSVADTQVKLFQDAKVPRWDAASLLAVLWNQWNTIFRRTLGPAERTLVAELRDVRNKWAHQEAISSDDTERALDSMARLLTAVAAPQADEVTKMRSELRRLVIDEQVRSEKRKAGGSLVEAAQTGSVKPWREVVVPHPDVRSGRYQQAEFAADLWQVHLGEGSEEYRNPKEFFRRTFLTESLKRLLVGGIERLSAKGGDPVVQLQTNFGGGKTHSMLALYHLFSGAAAADLAGVDALLGETGIKTLPKANRVVLVGNRISPGNPITKAGGTTIRTLWGELAWQLGFSAGGAKEAKKAFGRIAADDEKSTSPGDVLRELLKEYGPCLVLIDEWVAYARQLHDQSDLPAGSFETQFTFAQALTESAKLAGNCLLVVSLPASDTPGSPHVQADDVEVGGIRGREALDRLRNVVGRVESSWRQATAEEGFEIVRRRLFEDLADADSYKQRDVTARAFSELYRSQAAEFPHGCGGVDYEKRIQAAYPIHPEIFDRLYTDWSTLVKFQRTRGVLRLMAAVISSLWENGDRNPLILPATIPIDTPRVQFELTRYLSDNWAPIIERDVDGPSSLPRRIDSEQPNLGKLSATRRVARTIYLGSAPSAAAAHRGLEDRQVKLGSVMPGEAPQVFGDALRRLAASATYLYQEGPRYWYGTQPTVTKLADDKAEQLKRDPDKVVGEIERRVREDVTEDRREKTSRKGDFSRVHPLPQGGQDVPDELDARLVILGTDHPYSKGSGGPAEVQAKAIFESRGNAPRLYRNTLVFLAADQARLQDLDDAVRRYLAWESILAERTTLDLTPNQVKQAETQLESADSVVASRLPETYQWLLVPVQGSPQAAVEWQAIPLKGQEHLAVRASAKLRRDDVLVTGYAPSSLRLELDRVPLWRNGHVSIRQLTEDFGRYLYLPRLKTPEVLIEAIRDGLGLLATWEKDSFAYADSYDEATGRYRGLQAGRQVSGLDSDSPGLLVKPDVAAEQIAREAKPPVYPSGTPAVSAQANGDVAPETAGASVASRSLTRFHGSVRLDSARLGRDAGRIAEEIVQHLSTLPGANVELTLEIQATLPEGAPDTTVRTVTENCRTLKFKDIGFEEE